jgi:hypothetical protein
MFMIPPGIAPNHNLLEAVVQHHNEIIDAENQAMNCSFDFMSQAFMDLHSTTHTLDRIRNGQYNRLSKVWPRPSLALFNRFFQDTLRIDDSVLEARALDFVGQELVPLSGARSDQPTFSGVLGRGMANTCASAERRFYDYLLQITTGEVADPFQANIGVLHDEDRVPLAITKSITKSAMTLVPIQFIGSEITGQEIAASGIHAPAGAIGAIDETNLEKMSVKTIDGTTFTSYLTQEALRFRPTRLSPWAYQDIMDRLIFALEAPSKDRICFDPVRSHIVGNTHLDIFRHAASQLITA